MAFKLRCTLHGHNKDVRALAASNFPECGIVSGSRDVTAKVWHPNSDGIDLNEGISLTGHSGFVAAVCILPPSDQHPNGLIATGSNDHNIHIYTLDAPTPISKLTGHTNTVCSLAAGKHGTILSGSWDKTAKVWLNERCMMTLAGHEMAVWAVDNIPENGLMITGSADKTIKLWKAGRCTHTLKGHEDCVRGLAVLTSEEFISCSNDTSIRRWSIDGTVLQVYYGHENYVYAMCLLPSGGFASVGEDRSLRVWRDGVCRQTIIHPATSVWAVAALNNGDIVTGSSDGLIRVFSSDPSRQASTDIQTAFEQSVASSTIPTQVGDVDSSKLPGPEALLKPGNKEGQVIMVNEGGSVQAHMWSSSEQKWNKVGEVVGSNSGAGAGKRMTYLGQEYDYVFDIEVSEGAPALKLPYNMTDDPWFAAQTFIDKHGLSQAFLEEIQEFIVKNTGSMSMQQVGAGQSYQDPFTGGSRYTPGSSDFPVAGGPTSDPLTGAGRYIPGTDTRTPGGPTSLADPFTGGSSYKPAGDNSIYQPNIYFPVTQTIAFTVFKPEPVIKKLKELNSQLPGDIRCEEGDLNHVLPGLSDISHILSSSELSYLWRLLQWPADKVFPALDFMRVAIRNPSVNEFFCNPKEGANFIAFLANFLSEEHSNANHQLVLKILCNIPSHQNGIALLHGNRENLLPLVVKIGGSTQSVKQKAASTILLNYTIIVKVAETEARAELLSAVAQLSARVTDREAQFRLACSLGNLLWKDENNKVLAISLDLVSVVSKWKMQRDDERLSKSSEILYKILSSIN